MIKIQIKFLAILIILLALSCCKRVKKTSEGDLQDSIAQSTYLYNICIDSCCIREERVKKNQTLSNIMSDFGVSHQMVHEMVNKSKDVIDLRKINAGKIYTAIMSDDSLSVLDYLVYQENNLDFIVFNLKDTTVYRESKPSIVRRRKINAKIEQSLWETIVRLNASPLLAIKLSEIYESQIDFFEIMKTDSFSVIFDEIYVDDSLLVDIGAVHASLFNHRGKDFYAFAFYQDDKLQYFDEKGDNMKRFFLKAPLKYSRISSKFTNSRYHPVLKIYRAHHGVDYAAPSGTPVFAIGSGTVAKKGYQARGGGNYVTIKHPNGYKSTYMHLKGFAKGIQVGKRVGQGELIGYVGSTGLSTGAHLDFRIYKNDKPIDPLKVVSPPLDALHENLRDSFNVVKENRMRELKKLSVVDDY